MANQIKSNKKVSIWAVLAIVVGVAIVGGFVVFRSFAGTNYSFQRDPVTQMSGGKVVGSYRSATSPVYTLVSKDEFKRSGDICVRYKTDTLPSVARKEDVKIAILDSNKKEVASTYGDVVGPKNHEAITCVRHNGSKQGYIDTYTGDHVSGYAADGLIKVGMKADGNVLIMSIKGSPIETSSPTAPSARTTN